MFNLILDYIELFYDKADVVIDLIPYLRLLQAEDCLALREKVKAKIDAMEAGHSLAHHSHSHSYKLPELRIIRWKIVSHKLTKILSGYANLERNERLPLVNSIFNLFVHG
jgi:hypothetical protein